jgi:hypothetical protein
MHPERLKSATLVLSFCDDWPQQYGLQSEGKPDVFGCMQASAAVKLAKSDNAILVFNSKNVQKDGSIVAYAMAEETKKLLPSTDDSFLLIEPTATNTHGEVKSFKQLAKDNGWGTLQALTIEAHVPRVKRAIRRKFGRKKAAQISILITEKVLENEPLTSTIDWHDRHYLGMKRREKFLNAIDAIPFVGGITLDIIDKLLGNKRLEAASVKILARK